MAIFNLFVFYLSMKVQNFNPVNFQKRLVATCKIGSADNSCDAKIYLLDKKDDYYEEKNRLTLFDSDPCSSTCTL